MSKLKIVVLTDWYLPGTKAGGPVRSIYSLLSLLKAEFDFYIITTNKDLGVNTPYKNITPNSWLTKESINYFYFDEKISSSEITKLINSLNSDLIYVNSFWSKYFSVTIVKNAKSLNAPILLAPRGMLSHGAMQIKKLKKQIYLALAKSLGWYKTVSFHVTNEVEKQDLLKQFPKANLQLIQNISVASKFLGTKIKIKNELNLFYLSRIAEVKNLHFALECLKEIPSNYKINYTIFGNKEDIAYWNQCQEIIKTLPSNVNVIYNGELEFTQVQQTLIKFHALFLPTLNENFGHSIVESLCAGCPVIISNQTPWNDCETYKAGVALPLNKKNNFVLAIEKLAKLNAEEFNVYITGAVNYVNLKIDLSKNIELYKSMFTHYAKN